MDRFGYDVGAGCRRRFETLRPLHEVEEEAIALGKVLLGDRSHVAGAAPAAQAFAALAGRLPGGAVGWWPQREWKGAWLRLLLAVLHGAGRDSPSGSRQTSR